MSEENSNTETAQNVDAENLDVKTDGTVRHNKALLDDLVKYKGRVTALETEKAGYDQQLSAKQERIINLLTENAIKDVIGAYDVKPSLRPALVSHLKGLIKADEEGAMFGDKTPEDFGKEFFASEDGRDFLKPVINSGGGATGNTGVAPSTPDKWSLSAYAEMKAEDPTRAAAYAKKHGKNF